MEITESRENTDHYYGAECGEIVNAKVNGFDAGPCKIVFYFAGIVVLLNLETREYLNCKHSDCIFSKLGKGHEDRLVAEERYKWLELNEVPNVGVVCEILIDDDKGDPNWFPCRILVNSVHVSTVKLLDSGKTVYGFDFRPTAEGLDTGRFYDVAEHIERLREGRKYH